MADPTLIADIKEHLATATEFHFDADNDEDFALHQRALVEIERLTGLVEKIGRMPAVVAAQFHDEIARDSTRTYDALSVRQVVDRIRDRVETQSKVLINLSETEETTDASTT